MKKLVTTLSNKLLLLGVILGAFTLMASTAFAGTISSAANQAFAKSQATTAISTITITEDVGNDMTDANDIRIRIPINMKWDATDVTAVLTDTTGDAIATGAFTAAAGGACAASPCTVTPTYEVTDSILKLDVTNTANLVNLDAFTITGLSYKTFSAASANDNLDLCIDGSCAAVEATDDKTIGIGAPTIASAAAQKFATNQAAVAISAITITEDASVSVINSTDDIRITIPSGSNFIWDSADTALTLTDGAGTPIADTGKIEGCSAPSPCTVTLTAANFEDSNRTLVIPMTSFAAGDAFVVSGINYKTFSARSAGADNLDLEVANDATVVNVDTAAISVSTPTILSSAAQQFTSGMNTQPMDWTITITEDATVAIIGSANDFTIKIPAAFNMNFDSSDTSITVGGTGATVAKVAQSQGGAACANAVTCAVTPAYFQADGTTACTAAAGDCRAMRVPIDAAALAAGDILTVTGASLFNFSSASAADNLELEVVAAASFGTAAVDEDNVTMTIVVGSSTASQDRTGPSAPTGFAVSDQGVLTWTDPTATDLKEIEVLKGVGNDPVNGTPVAIVAKGLRTYTDASVTVGQTVKYILRAKDTSGNSSANTDTVTVVIAAATVEETTEDEAADDTAADDEAADDTAADDETADDTTTDDTAGDDAADDDAADDEGADEEEEEEMEVGADLSGHWSQPEVTPLIEYGIVQGDEDTGNVRPDANLNRAEAGALLYRVLGLDEPSEPDEEPFSDVGTDDWFAGYIAYLQSLELVTGNPDGTYRPANNINRAEFLTMAMRVYYYVSDEDTQEEIDDLRAGSKTDSYVDLRDDWYTANVTTATELGFVSGRQCTGGRCFDANANITRAEAAAILYRMFSTYLEERSSSG